MASQSIRAASNAERRTISHSTFDNNSARYRLSGDYTKQQLPVKSSVAVTASERKHGRTSPFRAVDTSLRSKESSKPSHRAESFRNAPASGRSRVDDSRGIWSPQASLVSASSAPLACRISVPPLAASAPREQQPMPLTGMGLQDQEHAILEDLLFAFMGFEGQYIRFMSTYNPLEEKERLQGPSYRIAPGLDPSLRDLALNMLRMATQYTALEAFVEVQSREEFGTINHALCAEIRKLLKDFLILIAQLEHQLLTNEGFTLHVMNLHMGSTSLILAQLYALAHEILKRNALLEEDLEDSEDSDDIENVIKNLNQGNEANGIGGKKICKGGQVLGLITKRLSSMSGDPSARTLLTRLLREASRPYMRMLNEWMHHGGIKDPHGEFLIKEAKSIKREGLEQDYTDEYWEKRYTIREADVPPQLANLRDKVLLAGKYLNVVRECGGVDVSQQVVDVPTSFDDPRFLDNVNSAYKHANTSLLKLLLTTHALPSRLRSLKHYFFLDRSDFFSYFLELGSSELKKPAKIVNTGKLQSLLEIVLRQPGSVAAEDPYKEDVRVQMNEISLTSWLMRVVTVTGLDQDAANTSMTQLVTPAVPISSTDDKEITGFDALVLDYMVPFPLSLVVSRVTLTRYQLLFRYLLSLRHLESLLTKSWTEHCKSPSWHHKSTNPKIEVWKRKAWTLRARMLVFVQQMLYFCTSEVIEPNWHTMMSRLHTDSSDGHSGATGRTVDELMQDHVDFLATCLKECMLTNSKLLRINSKVMSVCTMFAQYTSWLSRYLMSADPDLARDKTDGSKANGAATGNFDPSKLEKLIDNLQKYEDNFARHLKILLDALNYLAATETAVFMALCARLSTASEGVSRNTSRVGQG